MSMSGRWRGFRRVAAELLLAACAGVITAPGGMAGVRYAASYLRLGVGAEASALASTGSGLAGSATAFYWNPALAAYAERSAYFEYSGAFGSLGSHLAVLHVVAVGGRLGQAAGVQIGYVSYTVPDIPRYPEIKPEGFADRLVGTGDRPAFGPTGWFSNKEEAIYFCISRLARLALRFNWLVEELEIEIPVGVSFKLLHQSLDAWHASGVGLDVGLGFAVDLRQFGERPWAGRLLVAWRMTDVSGTRLRWGQGLNQEVEPVRSWALSYTTDDSPGIRWGFLLQHDAWVRRETRFGLHATAGRLQVLGGLGASGVHYGLRLRAWKAYLYFSRQAAQLGDVERLALEWRW